MRKNKYTHEGRAYKSHAKQREYLKERLAEFVFVDEGRQLVEDIKDRQSSDCYDDDSEGRYTL